MTIATLLDYFSYAIFAITVGLVTFKSLELWYPPAVGRPPLPLLLALPTLDFDEHLEDLERGLTLLSVIASTAPFIGLMGTVLHIIAALSRISTALDTAIISGPIATALNATLVGLASAVPAAAAHALFCRRLTVLQQLRARRG
jgi:hypothetical protein